MGNLKYASNATDCNTRSVALFSFKVLRFLRREISRFAYAAASRNIGVLLRYNGKCRAWANNLYATPDAVEKLIVEFVQRYEKFSDKQKLEFKTKNGLL